MSVSLSTPAHLSANCSVRSRAGARGCFRSGGFTFVEILFAIIILGIGFIMVLGVFPVAAVQQQATIDETTAAAVAKHASNTLSSIMSERPVAPTGGIKRLSDTPDLWNIARSELIAMNRRYAWTALYRRNAGEGFATVWIIVARSRNRDVYDPNLDLFSDPDDVNSSPCTLGGRLVRLELEQVNGGAVLRGEAGDHLVQAIAPGSILVVTSSGASGETSGRIIYVGQSIDGDMPSWEVAANSDIENLSGQITACCFGKGYVDPLQPSKGVEGSSQEVGVYVSMVPAK